MISSIQPENVVRRVSGLSIIRKKCIVFSKKPERFKIQHKGNQSACFQRRALPSMHVSPSLLEYTPLIAKVDESSSRVEFEADKWTNYDDYLLLNSTFSIGFGNW